MEPFRESGSIKRLLSELTRFFGMIQWRGRMKGEHPDSGRWGFSTCSNRCKAGQRWSRYRLRSVRECDLKYLVRSNGFVERDRVRMSSDPKSGLPSRATLCSVR